MPVAEPEPQPPQGVPVRTTAQRQSYAGDVWTGTGEVEFEYRDYVIRADKVTYNRITTEMQAEGHLQISGGPEEISITASHGDMRLSTHTARFYDVTGTIGVRARAGTVVYSTTNPFIVRARVLLEAGRGNYRVLDGSMTNCLLPKPDWELLAHTIDVKNGVASTRNTIFKLLGIPAFYIPYLRHPVDEGGRESGFLIPIVSNGSSIRGFTVGEQIYWVISRNMDAVIGSEYYSRRGFAPNGDFRYRGRGLDHLNLRWSALLDRGINQLQTSGPNTGQYVHIDQGGADILAEGRKDFSAETRLAANVEYLSSYTYRLVFNDNYWQAVSSEVKSDVSLTHAHNGYIPSVELSRLQNFASSESGNEVRILRLPSLRFDVLDHPLSAPPVYWSFGSSLSHLGRSEPNFHAHNDGRLDAYPHLTIPMTAGGWSIVPEVAARVTLYSGSEDPDLAGTNRGVPMVSHDALGRNYWEAALDVRPPAVERDFHFGGRVLRHVIEPQLTYRFIDGIGEKAQNVLLVDTTDIATDTNEVGFSLMQRLYTRGKLCDASDENACNGRPREWASWQIAQKFFIDPRFGNALIPGRRNVFTSTLDLSGIAFLTNPRNLSPVTSRLRFEASDHVRAEWDLDYDPKAGRLGSDNLFAGYTHGATTVGIGHALLNAVEEQGSAATLIQSQQIMPFLQIGRQNSAGFNLAANGGYDFVQNALQYAGVQAVYNWNCCGLTLGYRRFALGSLRDETQYLYSFTLANFGSVGDIRRSNTVFRDPNAVPAF
jgi:LPS-assembly protein